MAFTSTATTFFPGLNGCSSSSFFWRIRRAVEQAWRYSHAHSVLALTIFFPAPVATLHPLRQHIHPLAIRRGIVQEFLRHTRLNQLPLIVLHYNLHEGF